MGIDNITLAAAKNYVDETLVGAGALKGEDGFSPIIAENADNTDEVYKLNITTADKTFTTPNLKGNNGESGLDGADGLSPVISENVNNTEDSYKLDVTDKNGTFTTPNLKGKQGVQGLQGIRGEKGEQGEQGLQGVQGIKGDKGDDGYPFLIYREYNSIDEFDSAHFPEIGLMFMVKTGESFPVYRYTGDADTPYSYVTELATSEGIKGEKGDKGDTGEQGVQGEAGKDGVDGTTYIPSIGTVENAEEAFATVEIDEDTKQAVFNFGLPKGADGEKAVQFTPVITENNELAWENDGGLDNPPTVPIQQIYSNAPIGTVLSFAGQVAPNGYLLCDGKSYAVADYEDLYAVIGNTYGGDDANFNVPDYRETVLVGVGENTTDTIADHDVYELGEFKDDQLQDHTHTIQTGSNTNGHNITQKDAYSGSVWSTYSSTIKDGRKGTTTHGKQKGVTYIIKAFHTNEGVDSGVSDDVVEYVESKINPAIDISKVFSNGTLNIATLCTTYGAGRYVAVGQGTTGNGTVTIDIWTLVGGAISYIVNALYSPKTSIMFVGYTYENPTIDFDANYFTHCNHIAKVCTLA